MHGIATCHTRYQCTNEFAFISLLTLFLWNLEPGTSIEHSPSLYRCISISPSLSIHLPYLVDEKEVKDLERIFREISSGTGHGRMDKKALSKVFPPEMPQFLLDRIFTAFDGNLDGFIDSKEFICGLSPFCKGEEEEKLECRHRIAFFSVS
jgi:hypothetical protein